MKEHLTLSDEIERLLGAITSRIEEQARELAGRDKRANDGNACHLRELLEQEAKELSIVAAGYEDRGDETMADLIRVVRDEHLPILLEELRSHRRT